MIDYVTGWLKITKYDDKRAIPIANLVETMWLTRYTTPMEITYDHGSEFIGHEFRKYPIETKYGITTKPRTLGNPTSNAILERINQVLGNLVRNYNISKTYIDKDDPQAGILSASSFGILPTKKV